MLDHIQKHLIDIYQLEPSEPVTNFLLDPQTFRLWQGNTPGNPNLIREQVILKEDTAEDLVQLGLYLHPEVLENLQNNRPDLELNRNNFADFCSAIEGVSHFLFVDHRAKLDLPLSAIELELQAEVDKFVTIFFYFHAQDEHFALTQENQTLLLNQLFQAFRLRPHLSSAEIERYEMASNAAAKICKFLSDQYLRRKPKWNGLFEFLRKFYRRGFYGKITALSHGG